MRHTFISLKNKKSMHSNSSKKITCNNQEQNPHQNNNTTHTSQMQNQSTQKTTTTTHKPSLYLCEISNAISVLAPLVATIWCIATSDPSFPTLSVLVGWTAHAPSAAAYHLLTAYGSDSDIMLRMDHSLQLFAACTNFLAQTNGSPVTLLFVAMCIHTAYKANFWDLSIPRNEQDYANARQVIVAAVITSCLPMIYNDKIPQFCVAVLAFLAGGAITRIPHPLAYTPFHFALALFALALV